MAKGRVAHIDMAAGIMILWMMLGHVGASRLGFTTPEFVTCLRRVFFFFMPWFFYKSGIFFSIRPASVIANRGGAKIIETIRCLVDYRICNLYNHSTHMGRGFIPKTISHKTFESTIASKSCIVRRTSMVPVNFILCN